MEGLLRNQYIAAIFWGYLFVGFIACLSIYILMYFVWRKTTYSYMEMYEKREDEVPPELNYKKRKPFHWAPILIGFLERIFYTSAIISNQFTLIGVWVAFKIIGEWSDISSSSKNATEGVSRIRANNFLIGNALSLLFGILGGVMFRLVLDQNFLVEFIQKSYTLLR